MFRKALLPLFVMTLALLSVGCDDKIKTSDQDIKQIQYTQLRAMLADTKNPTILIDPRSPERYGQGHIEGAINIPLAQLVADEPSLANAINLVVYGTTWTDYLSPAAAKKLMALGYRNVFDFRGGVDAWKNEGGKIVGTDDSGAQPAPTGN